MTTIWVAALLLGAPATEAEPAAYALVVGSTRGGEGQQDLRWATLDAERVTDILVELSRFAPERVVRVDDPDRETLFAALDEVEGRLRVHAERGEKSRLFFYYSGHARAHALNLGEELVDLTELRERLLAMPATLTVAVLDACQSGAFSRVKGAEPTADFSYNSMTELNAEGLAVMASSTGTELSQESDTLRSSFFTHNLLVALRGAGDGDGDGRVTLNEAYQYAYSRTLVATAKTAVGGQHVTLETDLRTKGELVLSYPAEANSQLELPAELAGSIVVARAASGTVVAELVKSASTPMRLALPAGAYTAVVRSEEIRRCEVTLTEQATVTLDATRCARESTVAQTKGGPTATEANWSRYFHDSTNPELAAVLAALPVPAGLGHAYIGDWWPTGVFFASLEAAELMAFVSLYFHWSGYTLPRDELRNEYGVEVTGSESNIEGPVEWTVLLGLAGLYLATKVWETVDAFEGAKAYNESLLEDLGSGPSVSLVPFATASERGPGFGAAMLLRF